MQKYDLGEIYEILDKNIFVAQVTLAQICLAETPEAREYAQYMLISFDKTEAGYAYKRYAYKKTYSLIPRKYLVQSRYFL